MSKGDEPVVGVPFYVVQNPYQAGAVPPNAIFGDPKGIPIQQTIYRDSPAPFNCVYCGNTGITTVRYQKKQIHTLFSLSRVLFSFVLPFLRFLLVLNCCLF
jgi:hypothetical protein